jgi:hypothetical protein
MVSEAISVCRIPSLGARRLAVEISVIMCSSKQTGPSVLYNTTTKARRASHFSRTFDTLIMWLVSTQISSGRLQSASFLITLLKKDTPENMAQTTRTRNGTEH